MSGHQTGRTGLSVQHLHLEPTLLDRVRFCDRTTGNSKLHRFAQSDDCLHAKKILEGKGREDVSSLVSLAENIFNGKLGGGAGGDQEQLRVHSPARGLLLRQSGHDQPSPGAGGRAD